MNVLEIADLSFSYGKDEVLKNISLKSKKQSITAILAPNGTGKTTLFHNILGLLTPTQGAILVQNKDILTLSPSKRANYISYVPQEWASPFNYNTLDVMMMGLSHKIGLFGSPSKQDIQNALDLMEEIGISHLRYRGINELSGGERQMVLLGRALLQDTPILLLDEPTSHLDIKNQTLLFRELKNQVAKKSLSVIINIHDPNLVSAYADEVYLLKNGKNFFNGSVFEAMNEEILSKLYDVKVQVGFLQERPFIRAF